ncbi:hypothetical protein A2V61_03035 [Candidatus Woesebacteria bacterium RBG_19FT_COMBO_47_8]|uniref:Uncharacterized protein n=1 Tax=Candidatus Woesebacteria bacterium RBG_13_46_13 TaxID=1802479 RepID=A0A1F7X6K2_9BACT|nr:MAG: hypothetical protein A2Y68_01055 [Candidatus Woesebacteria bacterium RBG_13_46_13]OGM18146.1 MAG: hypothetical protein A2V61_03035 [Candidatus Woesebacteria bacterium RBG_19FT_COMBO_47_8]HJX59502.1 hypothetical protein [Patescibacteria group bacterium]
MRKELLFAIVAGGLFGLVIAFGIWRINSALSPRKGTSSQTESEKPSDASISIAKPSQNDVVGTSPVAISGVTKPNARVVVSGEGKDYFTLADAKGAFSQEVALIGGINELVVIAFDEKGVAGSVSVNIIYSTEFAKPQSTPEPTTEASTDSIRQKVQEKVNEALNSPTAYLGTVTDIAESSIQLKSASGEIQQVGTENSPTVIKDGKTPKAVKLTDIAIGDYIIAMGYKNGNHVISAQRILITTPASPSNRTAIEGAITDTGKNSLSIETLGKESLSATVDANTIVYRLEQDKFTKIKFSSLGEGNLIVVAGVGPQGKLLARTIFYLKSE